MKKTSLIKDIEVAKYFLKLTHKISIGYMPLLFFSSLIGAASPFINMIISKYLINELIGNKNINLITVYIITILFGNLLISTISNLLNNKLEIENIKLMDGFELHLSKHIINMDFEKLEDPEILDLKEQALMPIKTLGAYGNLLNHLVNIVRTTITLIGLAVIISFLNIFVILLIIAIVLLNSYFLRKSQAIQFKFHETLAPLNRKFTYYFYELASNFSMAKDVRIYNMKEFILGKIDDYNDEVTTGFFHLYKSEGKYSGLGNIMTQLQTSIAYAYIIYQVFIGAIDIGSFTMFIAATVNFSSNASYLFGSFVEFRQICKYLDKFISFNSIESSQITGTKQIEAMTSFRIEFKNVYFKYPRSKEYTLNDFSIVIHSNEKLSIVGLNGTGKTTFIKLLCRLYQPERGGIYLNGININEYDLRSYIQFITAIFQDFKVFAFTVKENVAFDAKSNSLDKDVNIALKRAGLEDKITTLDKGIDTSVYKIFDEEGIEFSGGENQKLAIARAIYKQSPIFILDEPTAALDPYAEYEIYSKFNQITQNSTVIYISHRLSSCKFCDKIAVIGDGQVVEYGTHLELLNKQGIYKNMWDIQSQNYT